MKAVHNQTYAVKEDKSCSTLFLLTLASFIVMFAFVVSPVQAQSLGGGKPQESDLWGTYSGPGPSMTTVSKAAKMPNGSAVAVKGTFGKNVGNEKYEFKDSSGVIIVDIEDNNWWGQNVGPNDLVLIYGEVDQDNGDDVEIEVYKVTKL